MMDVLISSALNFPGPYDFHPLQTPPPHTPRLQPAPSEAWSYWFSPQLLGLRSLSHTPNWVQLSLELMAGWVSRSGTDVPDCLGLAGCSTG